MRSLGAITDGVWGWHPIYRRAETYSPWYGTEHEWTQIGWMWTQEYSANEVRNVLAFCAATSGSDLYSVSGLGAGESPEWHVLWRRWPPGGGASIPGQHWELQAWIHAPRSEVVPIARSIHGCPTNFSAIEMLVTDQQNRKIA